MFHTNLVRYMRIKEKTPKDFYNNKDPRLNISESQFYRIKNGKVLPSSADEIKIAKVLEIDPNELFKRDPKKPKRKAQKPLGEEEFLSTMKAITLTSKANELKENLKTVILLGLAIIMASSWLLMFYVALHS